MISVARIDSIVVGLRLFKKQSIVVCLMSYDSPEEDFGETIAWLFFANFYIPVELVARMILPTRHV